MTTGHFWAISQSLFVQQDAHQAAIAALQREIQLLRAENAYLRDQVGLLVIAWSAKRLTGPFTPVHIPSCNGVPHKIADQTAQNA